MQIGDPKKTAVLAVVAVGAIGFCFKQLTAGGDQPRSLRQAAGAVPESTGTAPSGVVATLELEHLRTDPFSHTKLAPRNVVNPVESAEPPGSPAGAFEPGSAPAVPAPPFSGPAPTIEKERPGDWPSPFNPGDKPGVQIEKLTRLTLKAIVKVDQRMAFLSIDGEEARGYRAGDVIKGDIQVVFVNDETVIVKNSKTTTTLKVGQQGDL